MSNYREERERERESRLVSHVCPLYVFVQCISVRMMSVDQQINDKFHYFLLYILIHTLD